MNLCLQCARARLAGRKEPARGCRCTADPAPLWMRAATSSKFLVEKDAAERPGYEGKISEKRTVSQMMCAMGLNPQKMKMSRAKKYHPHREKPR